LPGAVDGVSSPFFIAWTSRREGVTIDLARIQPTALRAIDRAPIISPEFQGPNLVMQPGHIDVFAIPGVRLEHAPALTKLRLPARLRAIQWLGLALVSAIPAFVWLCLAFFVLLGVKEMSGLLLGASAVLMLFLIAVFLLARQLRSGAKVTIKADRLMVESPWSNTDKLELSLDEVRITATPDAILIFGGGEKRSSGTALDPVQRQAVVEFLNGVIAAQRNVLRKIPSTALAATSSADLNGSSGTAELVIADGSLLDAQADPDPREIRLLAICRGLQAKDKRNFCHIAPNIPQVVLVTALQHFLDIQDDEVLLAIVGVPKQGGTFFGCAITTERIYWPGKPRKSAGSSPPRLRSLGHEALPGIIDRKPGGSVLELREGRRIIHSGPRSLTDGLIALLAAARSFAVGGPAQEISEQDRATARLTWPRVVAANAEARALQSEIQRYMSRTQVVSRPVVTQLIALACVVVYAVMVARGVPAFLPTREQLVAWGADSGRAVIANREYWRLFTAVFLHVGLFHLFMNMLCLIVLGPVVERILGHLGFAALYVLSGIGGAIASAWANPAVVSAGASGAIFGIMGGLLGFLLVRHRDLPRAILKPMRAGAIGFVGYNAFFSLVIPGIDMAAHLGGLATGFVCGLLMTLVSPANARAASRHWPAVRRMVVAAIVALGLVSLAKIAFGVAAP
jgi:membrane associated rhomboid family serine protease